MRPTSSSSSSTSHVQHQYPRLHLALPKHPDNLTASIYIAISVQLTLTLLTLTLTDRFGFSARTPLLFFSRRVVTLRPSPSALACTHEHFPSSASPGLSPVAPSLAPILPAASRGLATQPPLCAGQPTPVTLHPINIARVTRSNHPSRPPPHSECSQGGP